MMLSTNTRLKIANISASIDDLLESDDPLSSGQLALKRLKAVFSELGRKLDRAAKLKDEVLQIQISHSVNVKILQSLPILGFILRSTHVRNAFELLDPLQSIADAVLQGKPKLIVSAEWDHIPFAYPQTLEDLRSFVLIGMPPTETVSALLSPLAGHELGHAVWLNRGVAGGVDATLQYHCSVLYDQDPEGFRRATPQYDPDDILNRELLPEAKEQSLIYATRQAEEIFCDMFAYAVFGESYLQAFAFILAPGTGRIPSFRYPTHKTRVQVLGSIAATEGVTLPGMIALHLSDESHRGSSAERFVLRIAETAVEKIVDGLWNRVTELVKEGSVPRPSAALAQEHLVQYRMGVPASGPRCLGDIVTSGWKFYRECVESGGAIQNKVANLNEILLKTIEVLEFTRRVQDDPQR